MTDQHELAPEVVISSCVWDMYPLIKNSVESIQAGTWEAKNLKDWSMMAAGGSRLAPYHSFDSILPQEVKDKVAELEKGILDGTFTVPVIEDPTTSD